LGVCNAVQLLKTPTNSEKFEKYLENNMIDRVCAMCKKKTYKWVYQTKVVIHVEYGVIGFGSATRRDRLIMLFITTFLQR
jgi:hypothetical protein